jgi:hypothetical protein
MDPEMQRPAGIGWPLELPAGVEGTIDPPGNEDRFRFQARKGEPLCLRLAYASLSSPLRPVLTLRDEAGALVVQQSSVGNQDVELTWTATADGWYVLTLTDAAGNGGPDYAYRLQLGPPAPGFQASLGPHCVRLEAGRTLELPLATWRLFNYEGLLLTLVNDLPAGVTVDTPLVPAQSGEVKITFTATAAAHPTNQPFRVVLAGAGADTPPPRAATIALRGRYAGPGQLLTNETDQLWLTVLPARKP